MSIHKHLQVTIFSLVFFFFYSRLITEKINF